ncbi:hypothetical protein TR51_13390 [Kitasatospora griseola]|uniref:Uncharacterized protein n=1 Tax=Kitasatospora griseola TaxID=2064 RepID=A0A0D0PR66_KITGR|nr:hypothetical protein [Kitasatospora griseola]KIQ65044.1 hypothetical protein TR51_13390 [Kitasatospora griseola]
MVGDDGAAAEGVDETDDDCDASAHYVAMQLNSVGEEGFLPDGIRAPARSKITRDLDTRRPAVPSARLWASIPARQGSRSTRRRAQAEAVGSRNSAPGALRRRGSTHSL